MKTRVLALGLAAAALAVGACNKDNGGNSAAPNAQTPEAKKAAGDKTIAQGLAGNGQFMAAAKAAGLDQTLAGAGPYTVLVPSDQAFSAAPAGTFDAKPENRAQLTGILTNLILPGTVLAADIDKAIDAGKGKAPLATMGGGVVTATKEAGKTVLTDAAGHKATITQADEQFSNGVVHQIDGVLMPSKESKAPVKGEKAG
ncbi:fasciclin domain-containing protein [Sphingomonas hankyongi]|uniref:Fasciclin domain-containing protein n=1 Tax=Sphingomonas hankyongi TaxID=2908209 RepID=A0ABT0S540_9SPHN|nr:fasciclin domain-containing protein [Sphingomonas hankyongi]MCL6730856.1 fasciclin domain-containing protein [Sphingomonas hankyongi]